MLASKAYVPHGWPIFGSISFAVVLPYASALGLTSRTAIILGGRALGLTNWSSNVGMAVGLTSWSRICACVVIVGLTSRTAIVMGGWPSAQSAGTLRMEPSTLCAVVCGS